MKTTHSRFEDRVRRARLILCAALLLLAPSSLLAAWTPLANQAPGGVGLMLLLSDGTVLAASRVTDPNEVPTSSGSRIWYRLTPNLQGSYVNGTWTTLNSMQDTRLWYSSAVLQDGRVLVAGAEYGTGGSSAEIFDPVSGQWTTTPAPGVPLSDSVSKILRDGRVMVGPASGGTTRIYNPATNAWSAGPTPQSSANLNEVTWLKLPDDSILTVPTNSQVSQRFLQTTNQWITDGNVGVNLYSSVGSEIGGAFLLPNGQAFFLGGDNTTAIYTPSGNNNPGTWVQGPNIPNVRNSSGTFVPGGAPDAGAAMMVNGRILCALSPQMFANPAPPPTNIFPTPTSFAIYDPVANSFATINGPTGVTVNVPAYQNLMLDLPDGTVLYANWGTQLYTYAPDTAPAPLAAGKPAITGISNNPDGTFHLTGTKLNGISEGASYGDDAQMDSNYPIVRITNSSGSMYYARTFNWSSTGVSTGSATVSTEFALPTAVYRGGNISYSLVVVANGISSDPVTFLGPVWVDFNYNGATQLGTFSFPYRTLAQGVAGVSSGGSIFLSGFRTTSETAPAISKPLSIVAIDGPATIGQ